MPQVPTIRSIRKNAYLYSCESIPPQLLEAILSHFEYDQNFEDENRVGIIGFPKRALEKYQTTREELLKSPYIALGKCADFLRDAIYHVRINLPQMNIGEWYLTSLACYGIGGAEPIYFMRDETENQIWKEYLNKGYPGSEFAEDIFNRWKIGEELGEFLL